MENLLQIVQVLSFIIHFRLVKKRYFTKNFSEDLSLAYKYVFFLETTILSSVK